MSTASTSTDFELIEDSVGRVTLRRPGQDDVADVRVRRSFPWSVPGRYLSIRAADGKELVLVDDLSSLAAGQRALLEKALAASTFIPRIKRVREVDVQFGYQQWTVDTDRGPASFRVQEREDIRFLADGRFTLKDADGNTYEMPALADLDEPSRRAIEALV